MCKRRQARKFSGGNILLWWGGTVAWFGFELFPLNKVSLIFINHGGDGSSEIKSSAWCSCMSWHSGSRKANTLPFLQVFKYIQTYSLAGGLNLSLRQNFLAVWTILTLAFSLTEYWNKAFPETGDVGELGGAPCLNLRKECVSPARHPGHLLCCVAPPSSGGVWAWQAERIYVIAALQTSTDPVRTQYQNISVIEPCGLLWAMLHFPNLFTEIMKGGRLLRVYWQVRNSKMFQDKQNRLRPDCFGQAMGICC